MEPWSLRGQSYALSVFGNIFSRFLKAERLMPCSSREDG